MNKLLIVIVPVLLAGCSIFSPSLQKTFERSIENAPYDAIIVPGVQYNGVNWSSAMKTRVHWSKYLYDNGFTKNIIYSGGAVYSDYYECKVMAEYGRALGIPDSVIFIDTLPEHSTENVYYGYRVAKTLGFKKIALATDMFQAKNVRNFINKYELPVSILPAIIDSLITLDRYEPTISAEQLRKTNFISIAERENMRQRLKGTLGHQIIWNTEDVKNPRYKKKLKQQGRLIE